MKIAIIDTLGLTYDGDTLTKRGLGGSESAVILISKELAKIGFDVTVFNNCIDTHCKPGVYDDVKFIDHTQSIDEEFDIAISSRSVFPFFANNKYSKITMNAKHRVLWMHDTFCQGDEHLEALVTQGYINEVFTLSDFHSNYTANCDHGNKRMFEVLKNKIWQTRNGAVKWIDEVDVTQKDKNLFVYNASATKGLVPLITKVWPLVKQSLPNAKLKCIGGFYRFKNDKPDEQEKMVRSFMQSEEVKKLDVEFTGVITQKEIADILSKSWAMLYPTAFPETFGISTLESLLYRTPVITNRFGALEEIAIDSACYKVDYPTSPNSLYPNINEDEQAKKIAELAIRVSNDPYLHQQKQYACDVIQDIYGWDTVALQWKQHFFEVFDLPLPVKEYRKVSRINDKVNRVFGRKTVNKEVAKRYTSYGNQRRIVVISPFYNAESYIGNCIRSVAMQDYDNYIHFLIDDASTDNSNAVADAFVQSYDKDIQKKFFILRNEENKGAIFNQVKAIEKYTRPDDIVMLLDGDDWLVNNNTIFHYYNDLYEQGHDFTYGSCWSVADKIPLVAQSYSQKTIDTNDYRKETFNWIIPYSHLRTFKASLFSGVNQERLKMNNEWMKAGADTPLFYELIENSKSPYAVKEIMVKYNDVNPLNDYKVNGEIQNMNARSALL